MQSFSQFLIDKFPVLLTKINQQLLLACSATLLAIIISVPLGIWVARDKRVRGIVLSVVGVLQTIPSLALLAFLIPVMGIGVLPAIVTLCLYALLPIVSNTATGLLNISPSLIEAADGLGFTPWQKLRYVELPLALPVILAGVRTAMTMSMGIATVAAFVGAGGLGDFIYEGLSLNHNRLILLGAIPAAALALSFDLMLRKCERWLDYRQKTTHRPKMFKRVTVFAAIVIILMVTKPLATLVIQAPEIRVGARNYTEQHILGEIVAQLIEQDTKIKVVRKFNLGGAVVAHNALKKGNIDIYPEYTGTAFGVLLKGNLQHVPKDLFHYLQDVYQQRFELAWLEPLGFNNHNVVAVVPQVAKRYQLQNLSDLAKKQQSLTIGVPIDFMGRPDGYLGLRRTYGIKFGDVRLMEPGLMYAAIANDQIDLIMGYNTDARMASYHLQKLQDDKHLFPDYHAALVLRDQLFSKYPKVVKKLQRLSGLIDDRAMLEMNGEVDQKKRDPAVVAHEFLLQHKLVSS